jgi:hypothetical protein
LGQFFTRERQSVRGPRSGYSEAYLPSLLKSQDFFQQAEPAFHQQIGPEVL